MKIQRVMKMMKIEPENLAGHPEKVGVKRAKVIFESHFCEKNTQPGHQLQSDEFRHKVSDS